MTNVPSPVFNDAGLSVPLESDIVAGLNADFREAFGSALNTSPATPQGQLIASLAAMIGASNNLFLSYVAQVDPAFASGRMQDAIARIYYLSRKGALPTTVTCVCTGATGTIIPPGALAQAVDGTIYQSLGQVTIPSSGSVPNTFAAIDDGPIACPAGTLTKIYRVVPGWDTVNNPTDGSVGRVVESRSQFEARRSASVAINALGILPSIRAAILNVPDVLDAYVTENPTNASQTVGSVTIPANSLYLAVLGGTDADVARAIWKKKAPGCRYYPGNTTVTVQDTSSGYSAPYPSYSVVFQRPTPLPIYFTVSLTNGGAVPSDVQLQVRTAMAAAFNGEDGGARARMGATLYASRFYAAIASLGPWAQILSITVGAAANPTGTSVAVPINQAPTLSAANVIVNLV